MHQPLAFVCITLLNLKYLEVKKKIIIIIIIMMIIIIIIGPLLPHYL